VALTTLLAVVVPVWYLLAAAATAAGAGRPALARPVGYGGAALGGAGGLVLAGWILLGGEGARVRLAAPTPFLELGLRVDALAAVFTLALSAAVLAVSVAAIGYARRYDHHGGARLAVLYNLFAATMLLVLLADGVFAFLLAWEVMSLVGYLLVVHEHERAEVRRAGFVYLVMAHLGTGFIVVGLLLLVAGTPGAPLEFGRLAVAAAALPPLARDGAFLACLIGFGVKAGCVPLHVWLPRAHPVAPGHVSALMSGVMLKTALYGLARVAFDVLGSGPAWWGWLVLGLGLLSALLGILYALVERDLKRLLAYSSIENVGLVLIGFGAALVLSARGAGAGAGLALAAALLHVLNHALFKPLLFVGAGAVDHAAGTRDLDRLGGLVRRMPQTGALFLVGALAIAALPPLNGFASEWLTFQALLVLAADPASPLAALAGLAAAAMLALTAGLAAAGFVKAFGIGFLGLARSEAAAAAAEAPGATRAGMALLALACLLVGLLPGAALGLVAPGAAAALHAVPPSATPAAIGAGPAALAAPGRASVVPTAALGLGAAAAAVFWLLLRLLGPVPFRRGPVWVCGFGLQTRMQYTASAFAEPARLFFRAVLRTARATEAEWALRPYFVRRLSTRGILPGLIEHHLYTPLARALLRLANELRVIQSGSLRTYLLYVFATLLVLLLVAR
jgi:hydrogenase-4 component B